MNKVTSYIAIILAVVAIAIGGVSYNKVPSVVKGINGGQGAQGPIGPQGPRGDQGVAGPMGPRGFTGPAGTSDKLGALPGNALQLPDFSVNGVTSFNYKRSLSLATTTICAIQAPTTATSSLIWGSLYELISSTTASIVDFGRATTAFATTTLLNTTQSIGANAQVSLIASTSQSTINGLNNPIVFPPGTWFVINQVAGPGLNVSPTGTCQAEFRTLN